MQKAALLQAFCLKFTDFTAEINISDFTAGINICGFTAAQWVAEFG